MSAGAALLGDISYITALISGLAPQLSIFVACKRDRLIFKESTYPEYDFCMSHHTVADNSLKICMRVTLATLV